MQRNIIYISTHKHTHTHTHIHTYTHTHIYIYIYGNLALNCIHFFQIITVITTPQLLLTCFYFFLTRLIAHDVGY